MHKVGRNDSCPCGSGQKFKKCCEPFVSGSALPATAEQLMRSRYTAYATGNASYLFDTTHPENEAVAGIDRADFISDTVAYCRQVTFTGLTIHDAMGPDEQGVARVKFTARFRVGAQEEAMTELSQFVKMGDRWLYKSGQME